MTSKRQMQRAMQRERERREDRESAEIGLRECLEQGLMVEVAPGKYSLTQKGIDYAEGLKLRGSKQFDGLKLQ